MPLRDASPRNVSIFEANVPKRVDRWFQGGICENGTNHRLRRFRKMTVSHSRTVHLESYSTW